MENIARSSNGRTTVSGTVYLGSSPSLAASDTRRVSETERRRSFCGKRNADSKAGARRREAGSRKFLAKNYP